MSEAANIPVSELIVRYLERLGVGHVFGMPGAHILPVYDALHDSAIHSVLAKHEQGAAFMAGGLARATGRIGACIATAGPGATNLVTGIANAYADRLPVIAITGEAPTHIFGRGGLQESSGEGGSIDQLALFRAISRYNKIVERTDYLPHVLDRAAKILLSGRPGPVVLSFPFNVQRETVPADMLGALSIPGHRSHPSPRDPRLQRLADMLTDARSPVLVAGYGCLRAHAQDQVARLSEQLQIPVTTSLKAKGVIDEGAPLALGSLGVTSAGHARRYIMEEADLLVFLGAGFNERTSYVWNAELLAGRSIVQIDLDPDQLEKVFQADLAIQGDIRRVLDELLDLLGDAQVAPRGRDMRSYRADSTRRTRREGSAIFDTAFALVEAFYRRLAGHFPRGLSLFDDNIIYAQSFFDVSAANRYYPNTGISSLGHALPAAIGARFAERRTMFAVLGDGGFQMCCMEIMTAVNYSLPLNVVVFNNASMGLIRKNQHQQYAGRYIDCDFVNPDFAALARAFGIKHFRVAGEEDLEQLFATADFHAGTNLIEILVDRDAFPNYLSKR